MQRSVFISYAHADRTRAVAVTTRLRQAGWTVWVDEAGIRGGARWAGEIERAIGDSSVFLVLVSAAAAASEWVDRELLAATDLRVPVVAAELEDTPLPPSMQFILRNRQRVMLTTSDNQLDQQALVRLEGALIEALEEQLQSNPDATRLRIGSILMGSGSAVLLAAVAIFVFLFVTVASADRTPEVGPDGRFIFPDPVTVAGLSEGQAFALTFAVFVTGGVLAAVGQGLRRSARLRGVHWAMRRGATPQAVQPASPTAAPAERPPDHTEILVTPPPLPPTNPATRAPAPARVPNPPAERTARQPVWPWLLAAASAIAALAAIGFLLVRPSGSPADAGPSPTAVLAPVAAGLADRAEQINAVWDAQRDVLVNPERLELFRQTAAALEELIGDTDSFVERVRRLQPDGPALAAAEAMAAQAREMLAGLNAPGRTNVAQRQDALAAYLDAAAEFQAAAAG